MAVEVFTARMDYKGADFLDVTRKQARPGTHLGIGVWFAPSPGLLSAFLKKGKAATNGEISDRDWLEYVESYTREMRHNYKRNRAPWTTVLSLPRVVCLCFCVESARCHRTILAQQILPKLGAQYKGEVAS